jgi:AcrR family transcriptional regulator
MAKKGQLSEDHSTEDKIKQAARKVFTQKGYAATRTRDIAEEAGMNLALLNYYFRSKEKLFDIVMMETMQQFIMAMKGVFNNEKTSLHEKVIQMADNYIELFRAEPNIPLFVLSEMRSHPDKFVSNMGVKKLLHDSHFFKQVMQATKGKMHPLHFMMNMIGMTVFPFVAAPLLRNVGNLKQQDFDALMQERKKMIPVWMDAMFKIK